MTNIPCRCCGIATDKRVTWQPDLTTTGRASGRRYEVGECGDCVSLRPDEPGSAVRAALRLLGKDEGDWSPAADAFDEAGVDVSALLYVGQVRPRPQAKAWGHVTKDDMAELRRGYAKVLDHRVHAASGHDRPVPPHAPPHGRGGCTACGVATSTAWQPVWVRVAGPSHTDEALCCSCAETYAEVGAWGPSFFERSALQAKGMDWQPGLSLPGLRPWAALDIPPNLTPWEHIALSPPEPDLTPLQALQVQVADLQREVAALRAGVAR